ncbi:predicted protein [Sclerotinia sclerotiorum 1980 UF-70]|uniref:Uncharacterized protein n=2 Tax=Sclerotinia sclerotiorum (strain ATCC 18683 / 1980 / Ss-1) TaxID=665079 RepID=A7F899_SCLS1|nr:predicted protein [Sclerotinia sclerotiorum 1980 UF-70]APA13273.1 hypothetical protein sscle_10g080430 [Sclerotinia sclerotiorum 1980 UF-70]EDN98970.1 predicted protein [Sclerotinia sclerotiorum 1980 UF-70]
MVNSQSTAQYRNLPVKVDHMAPPNQNLRSMVSGHETILFHLIHNYMNSEDFLAKTPFATNREYTPELFKHLQENFPAYDDTDVEVALVTHILVEDEKNGDGAEFLKLYSLCARMQDVHHLDYLEDDKFIRAMKVFRPGGYEIRDEDTFECLLDQASSFSRSVPKGPGTISDLIRRPAASIVLMREMKRIINVNSGQPDEFRLADFMHFNHEEAVFEGCSDLLDACIYFNREFESWITTAEYEQYCTPLIYKTLEMKFTNMDPDRLSQIIDKKLKVIDSSWDEATKLGMIEKNVRVLNQILDLNMHQDSMRQALTTLSIAYQWPKQRAALFLAECSPWDLCYELGGIETDDGSSVLRFLKKEDFVMDTSGR